MKTHYQLLLVTFILSLVSGLLFMIFYGSAILSLIGSIEDVSNGNQISNPSHPKEVLRIFFNPALIVSGVIGFLSSVTNMIVGIIIIAANKSMKEGERVLWILGFILLNTVTNIVFLALRKTRNLIPQTPEPHQSALY